jgi:prophage antirepressor-like protein
LNSFNKDGTLSLIQGSFIDLDYEGRRVRFVGTPDAPEWIAQDVCDAIGIESASRAVADFDDDEKGMRTAHTLFGNQKMLTVYEPGLYRLLMKSRKPEAKKFQKWVFKEVLPSIRKFGIYPPPEESAYVITLKPYTARIVWVMQVRRALPKDYWCVFIEGSDLLIGVEQIFGPADLEMKQYDLLDGSIGKRWSSFRQDKPWMGAKKPYTYTFPKGDPRGTVQPWCYPMQELGHFKTWLHGEYWTINFPEYVKRKYGMGAFKNAIPLFAEMGVPLSISSK